MKKKSVKKKKALSVKGLMMLVLKYEKGKAEVNAAQVSEIIRILSILEAADESNAVSACLRKNGRRILARQAKKLLTPKSLLP